MHEDTPPPDSRRHLLDGGYAVFLLTLAVVTGYVVLAPSTSRARPVPQVATVGAVVTPAPVTPTAPVAAVVAPTPAAPAKPVEPPVATALATPPPTPEPPRARPEARPPVPEPRVVKPDPAPEFPWPSPTVSGRVLDAERKPLAGASVVVRGIEVRTDAEGAFKLEQVPPDATLTVKLPGFEKLRVPPTKGAVEAVSSTSPPAPS